MSDNKELKQRLEQSERQRSRIQKLLARRPQEEEPFLWSMVDIMTLLLIFFILLYSTANNRVSAQTANPSQVEQKTSRMQSTPERELRHEVEQLFATDQAFSVRWDQAQPVFVLGEPITFEVGRAELIPDFKSSLGYLADFIARHPGYQVVVAGHTDDVPIRTARFPSNWELSTERAVSVIKFLCMHGVAPERLSVQGYAEYFPLQDNVSEQNRQANRRVEITLVKEDSHNSVLY